MLYINLKAFEQSYEQNFEKIVLTYQHRLQKNKTK